ncbi:MAG: prepilin peptidase [Cardiobacterium sp.]|jgi:type 4 prepilin-like proteins leader peptide-processing enzyme
MISLDTGIFQMPAGFALVGILGLMVGSFLNVVVYRLPLMIQREEKFWAWEVLNNPDENDDKSANNPYRQTEIFNLMLPGSHCPKCNAQIRFWQNIPVISYLWQRGRCTNCGTKISIRYLLVELLCAIVSILVVLKYPDPMQLGFALLLTWGLLALIFIDAENQVLPDVLTLPLMWLGILAGCIGDGLFVGLNNSIIGTISGYLILWVIYWVYRLIAKKEGLGYGDFKLLALLCAWQGFSMIPFILFLSSLTGIIFAITRKIGFGKHLAFGPYLAIAGWLTFMYGGEIAQLTGLSL